MASRTARRTRDHLGPLPVRRLCLNRIRRTRPLRSGGWAPKLGTGHTLEDPLTAKSVTGERGAHQAPVQPASSKDLLAGPRERWLAAIE